MKKRESKNMVYRLKKAPCGLKQAPRAWYNRIDTHFVNSRFHKCPYEHTLYIKTGNTSNILIVCLYVDDLIFTGNDERMFKEFKESMMHEFEMTDLGKMKYFLGIKATQSAEGIFICQKQYAQGVLKRFKMDECNSVLIPTVPGSKLTKDVDGVRIDRPIIDKLLVA